MVGAAIALVACGAVISFVIATSSSGGQTRPEKFRVSEHGRAVPLRSATAHRLDQAKTAANVPSDVAYWLASRAGLAFYRIGAAGGSCYGVGDATTIGLMSKIACWDAVPVMDYSVYEISKADPGVLRVEQIAGIADDAVTSVAFLDPAGQVVARIPVSANVYAAAGLPTAVAGIEGLDSSGKVIYSRDFSAAN